MPRRVAVSACVTETVPPAVFFDQLVRDQDVLIRYTFAGDADLNGTVNLNDFTMLAANFGETGRVFSEGNFNYDAGVDLNDFTILASQFGKTLPGDLPRAAGRSLPAASAPADRPAVFGTARLDDSRLRALLEENQPFVV